jgi:hypothetical protein
MLLWHSINQRIHPQAAFFVIMTSSANPVHEITFVPWDLVTNQVGCLSASVYPKVDPSMPVVERTNAFQVVKSALEALPVNMRLILLAPS